MDGMEHINELKIQEIVYILPKQKVGHCIKQKSETVHFKVHAETDKKVIVNTMVNILFNFQDKKKIVIRIVKMRRNILILLVLVRFIF